MTTGDIQAHLAEICGTDISRDTISRITDAVVEDMVAWQNRPLDRVYPVILIDAIVVKIRDGQVANRPIYVAMGVNMEGERDVLGCWVGPTGGGEGAKFWMTVLQLDLRDLRLDFLSACETAAVRPQSSDAPEGLAHAFLAAGATCVIGSRWLVNDASSMVLALGFYERWVHGGMSAGEALHDVQRWLRTACGYELALMLAPHVGEADRHV
jgi:Transposase, Mutator family/CHAT domain